jgi:hypothetical protein
MPQDPSRHLLRHRVPERTHITIRVMHSPRMVGKLLHEPIVTLPVKPLMRRYALILPSDPPTRKWLVVVVWQRGGAVPEPEHIPYIAIGRVRGLIGSGGEWDGDGVRAVFFVWAWPSGVEMLAGGRGVGEDADSTGQVVEESADA